MCLSQSRLFLRKPIAPDDEEALSKDQNRPKLTCLAPHI